MELGADDGGRTGDGLNTESDSFNVHAGTVDAVLDPQILDAASDGVRDLGESISGAISDGLDYVRCVGEADITRECIPGCTRCRHIESQGKGADGAAVRESLNEAGSGGCSAGWTGDKSAFKSRGARAALGGVWQQASGVVDCARGVGRKAVGGLRDPSKGAGRGLLNVDSPPGAIGKRVVGDVHRGNRVTKRLIVHDDTGVGVLANIVVGNRDSADVLLGRAETNVVGATLLSDRIVVGEGVVLNGDVRSTVHFHAVVAVDERVAEDLDVVIAGARGSEGNAPVEDIANGIALNEQVSTVLNLDTLPAITIVVVRDRVQSARDVVVLLTRAAGLVVGSAGARIVDRVQGSGAVATKRHDAGVVSVGDVVADDCSAGVNSSVVPNPETAGAVTVRARPQRMQDDVVAVRTVGVQRRLQSCSRGADHTVPNVVHVDSVDNRGHVPVHSDGRGLLEIHVEFHAINSTGRAVGNHQQHRSAQAGHRLVVGRRQRFEAGTRPETHDLYVRLVRQLQTGRADPRHTAGRDRHTIPRDTRINCRLHRSSIVGSAVARGAGGSDVAVGRKSGCSEEQKYKPTKHV